MRRALIGVLLLTAVTASACSSSGAPSKPAKGPAGGGGRLVSASFADKGRTMTVHVGDVVRVRLDSTYWKFGAPTTAGVLRAGAPVVHATTAGRLPGMGGGTIIESFTAVKAGRTVVTASRTSCGEAMRCTDAAGAFRLTVVVS